MIAYLIPAGFTGKWHPIDALYPGTFCLAALAGFVYTIYPPAGYIAIASAMAFILIHILRHRNAKPARRRS